MCAQFDDKILILKVAHGNIITFFIVKFSIATSIENDKWIVATVIFM